MWQITLTDFFNVLGVMLLSQELWRLVDAIYLKGLKERNIFLTQGNPSEVRYCLAPYSKAHEGLDLLYVVLL